VALEQIMVFLRPFRQILEQYFKTEHDRFLSHTFQFITECCGQALLRIRKIPGSNLGVETRYPKLGFYDFPQSLKTNAGAIH
jgi:hypothetical protein